MCGRKLFLRRLLTQTYTHVRAHTRMCVRTNGEKEGECAIKGEGKMKLANQVDSKKLIAFCVPQFANELSGRRTIINFDPLAIVGGLITRTGIVALVVSKIVCAKLATNRPTKEPFFRKNTRDREKERKNAKNDIGHAVCVYIYTCVCTINVGYRDSMYKEEKRFYQIFPSVR